MYDFMYFAPTKVVFGKKAELKVGDLIKEEGASKAMVVYGGSSAKRSGLLDRVFESLTASGIEYCSLGGVKPNPRLSKVYEGIALAKEFGAEFLLAVGGGSVIDTCKAIGAGLCYDGDVWDLYIGKAICAGSAPVGAILTIAATGSEMSNGSVITKDENKLKRSFDSNYCQCKFAIMNPELTYTLPPFQTASGCTDIMMHTMERYFSTDCMGLTDAISEALLRSVMENTHTVLAEPDNYDARANIMWAGSLSHNGLTGCGTVGDWAPHMIEHELGGMFDVAHGAGLAAIWGSWARYVMKVKPARFAQFAKNVMGIDSTEKTDDELAKAGIESMESFLRSINMPINLRELGCEPTDAQITELANKCCDDDTHTVGHFMTLNSRDVASILTSAK
jgi:alcohol dehydrogenase